MLSEMVILGFLARLLYKRELPGLNLNSQNIQTQICVIGDVYSEKKSIEQKESGVINLSFQNNNNSLEKF